MKRLGLLILAVVVLITACIPCILAAGSREALRAAAGAPAELVLVILALVVVVAVLYVILRR